MGEKAFDGNRSAEDRDRDAVLGLLLVGDALGCMRNVQHHSRFTKRDEATDFANAIRDAGYHMEVAEGSIHECGVNQWLVEFSSFQACDLSSVQRHTRLIQEIAAKHHGDYLGWLTQPVRLRKPDR